MAEKIDTTRAHNFQDLTGRKFWRWTVVEFTEKRGDTPFWRCVCVCGTERVVSGSNMKRGQSKSCGCLKSERTRMRLTRHGHTVGHRMSSEYGAWSGIVARCENERCDRYQDYGGRGIKMCQRWRESFEAFLEDMGPRPSSQHSIDRIDNDGNYEPDNCRWATRKEQGRNTRGNRLIAFGGEIKSMAEWAEQIGMHPMSLMYRLNKGWTIKEAITIPIGEKRHDFATL